MATDALRMQAFNNFGWTLPGSVTNHVVDASTEGIAFPFQALSADPITHVGFRYGARTGTPPTYLARLEGLDSGGLPDNADVGGGSATAVTFTPPADASIDGLWQWYALTNAYTPSRGQFLCGVIRYSSGTIDGSNNSSFSRSTATSPVGVRGWPYSLTNTAGTWSKNAAPPIGGWRTASGRFGYIYQSTYTTATANTATHKSGMYFTLPSGLGTSYQILGLSFVGDMGIATGSCKVGIWSTDGTERQIVTVDSDHLGAAPGNADNITSITFSNANLYDFLYGTKYYAGIEVVSGAVGVNGLVLAEAADRSAYPMGTQRGLVTYNGSFTETDTVLPLMDLIFNSTAIPTGGGGGFIIGVV